MADPIATDKSAPADSPAEPASSATLASEIQTFFATPSAEPATPASDVTLLAGTVSAPISEPAAAAAPAHAEPPTQAEPAPQRQLPVKDSRVKPLKLLMLLILFGITGVGSLMLLASSMHDPERRADVGLPPAGAAPVASAKAVNAPEAVDHAVAPAPRTAAHAVEPMDRAVTPKWTATANTRKAGYGALVFELAANEDIEVWRKRVRPVLTMRCAGRTSEVFIVTQTPAMIEDKSNRHTVKIAFDGREAAEQHWEHSIDHDALFSPNGPAMMRQITGSREMSFSFAPFNAPPATVTFSTEGFEAHQKAAASKCRS